MDHLDEKATCILPAVLLVVVHAAAVRKFVVADRFAAAVGVPVDPTVVAPRL
jgi:hypothetical protein